MKNSKRLYLNSIICNYKKVSGTQPYDVVLKVFTDQIEGTHFLKLFVDILWIKQKHACFILSFILRNIIMENSSTRRNVIMHLNLNVMQHSVMDHKTLNENCNLRACKTKTSSKSVQVKWSNK